MQHLVRQQMVVDCPRSVYYFPEEFIALNKTIGLKCSYLGAAISIFEMSLLSKRFDAIR